MKHNKQQISSKKIWNMGKNTKEATPRPPMNTDGMEIQLSGHHYDGVSMPADRTVAGVPSKHRRLGGVLRPHNVGFAKNTDSLSRHIDCEEAPPLIGPNNHMILLLHSPFEK